MSWNGNINNPAPNNLNRGTDLSGIKSSENRALNVRRDKDTEKNFTVRLIDIDTAIFTHVDKIINIHVLDNGTNIKLPIHYASPEKWNAIQKDGVLRDQQGKIQLPVMIFRRTGFSKNTGLMTLNRHLTYPVLKKYNDKNKYDKFSILNGHIAETNQVFAVTLPDHINVSYEFTCWCEYIEQLNTVIQKINFACEEYWGDPKRFKFRVYSSDFTFTTENSEGSDRIVKSSFDLNVKSYLLEETFENRSQTVNRFLTPRSVRIGTEIVSSKQLEELESDINKKPFDYSLKNNMIVSNNDTFEPPKINVDGQSVDISGKELDSIRSVYEKLIIASSTPPVAPSSDELSSYSDIWKTAPTSSSDPGSEGWMAYDGNYHYIYSNGGWKRRSIASWDVF